MSQMSYFKKKGDPYIFAAGMGLIISLGMVAWILIVILAKGLGFFWPRDLVEITLDDGKKHLGEMWEKRDDANRHETQLKSGNRDLNGIDFVWMDDANIVSSEYPEGAFTFERMEYGNFYGYIVAVNAENQAVTTVDGDIVPKAYDAFELAHQTHDEIVETQQEITDLTEPLTRLQREISLLEIDRADRTEEGRALLERYRKEANEMEQAIAEDYLALNSELEKLVIKDRSIFLSVRTADGRNKDLQLSHVVRFFAPNQMGVFEKIWHYIGKLWEFVADDPREANTEGGVFPAIFGTVMMVILMSIAVVPFGVMAAIYLNEYAKQGVVTRFIRLSVNNLAGVPSIVFGVFGLGFFIYFVGGSIDHLFFSDKLPEPTLGTGGILWASLTLALLTLPVVVVATEEGLLAVPRANKEGALALGATRWQMIRKVVLPNAMPGILTGLILAISRGAGEVAPLMITGVVKLAPTLALDATFPFLHLDRKFMHLGFHIYDVGFQSPNVEAAKPMVYSTALLLIVIVILLNIVAIYVRNNLRKRYKSSTF